MCPTSCVTQSRSERGLARETKFRFARVIRKMASCEPSRQTAYSEDLRWRVVHQRETLGLSYKEIAKNLCIDPSTVSRIVKLFWTTGAVAKKSYSADMLPRKFTDVCQMFVLFLVLDRPGIYLREIQSELRDQLGLELSISAICKFLHLSGFTHQRLQITAIQRDEVLRAQFVAEVSMYRPEMLVYLDESGCDRRQPPKERI